VKSSVEKKSIADKKTKAEDQTRETAQKYTRDLEVRNSLHPRSRHSILNPGPLRTALLRWFATVKDSRGMPWRKSLDFSQGPEERSQRAYEVMRMLILTVGKSHICVH
jgi:A/G-specific adenine glycosylase